MYCSAETLKTKKHGAKSQATRRQQKTTPGIDVT